eukprot:4258165-Amphidinium_carterae.1
MVLSLGMCRPAALTCGLSCSMVWSLIPTYGSAACTWLCLCCIFTFRVSIASIAMIALRIDGISSLPCRGFVSSRPSGKRAGYPLQDTSPLVLEHANSLIVTPSGQRARASAPLTLRRPISFTKV